MIKKMNDFVLGILVILLSAFLMFGKITETEVKTGQGGFLVRSDVWLRMMGLFLFVVAVILIIRSLNLWHRKEENAEPFHFYIDSTVIAVTLSLIAYALALPVLGFFISTFVICMYLVILFSIKEKAWTFRSTPKEAWGKLLLKGVATAAVLLLVFWAVFGKLLAIQLPTCIFFE